MILGYVIRNNASSGNLQITIIFLLKFKENGRSMKRKEAEVKELYHHVKHRNKKQPESALLRSAGKWPRAPHARSLAGVFLCRPRCLSRASGPAGEHTPPHQEGGSPHFF